MLDEKMEHDAFVFAELCHRNQFRKYIKTPYIEHPLAVADLVRSITNYTSEMICAALLHDVVEDCGVSIETIKRIFGHKVSHYVSELTESTPLAVGNRTLRKELYAVCLSHACEEVQTIKVCDLINNSPSIILHDPRFSEIYIKEMDYLVSLILTKADPTLLQKAQDIVHDYKTNYASQKD